MKTPARPQTRKAVALLTLALLGCVPFIFKRGCRFAADFDPVAARTNTPPAAVTNR